MKTQDLLEKELTQLDVPDAPENLLDRCLATVPAKRRSWNPFTAMPVFLPKLALTAVVIVAVGFVSLHPLHNHSGNSGSGEMAFAQSLNATKSVPFWHAMTRHKNIASPTSAPNIPAVSQDWSDVEVWFDETKGSASINYWGKAGDRDAALQEVFLPSGMQYLRFGKNLRHQDGNLFGGNKFVILNRGVTEWTQAKLKLASEVFDLEGGTGKQDQAPEMTHGEWQGQHVNIFTIVQEKRTTPLYSLRYRRVIYTDPKTGHFLAKQVYTSFPQEPNRAEVLTGETVYTYDRPAASVFALEPLRKGASAEEHQKIVEEKDKNGVVISFTMVPVSQQPDKSKEK